MSIIGDIINELAGSKDWVEDKVTEQSYNISIHLIKVYLWRDSTYKNHWIKEIHGFLPRIQKLKKKNKYPKKEDIYVWLWEEDNEESFDEDLRHEIMNAGDEGEYKNLQTPKNVNYNDVRKFVSEYMVWLSGVLSRKGRVYKEEVMSEIEDLLKKHPYKLD